MKSDTGPFSLVPEWVLDATISDRAVRMYAVLGRYADELGICWPSRRTLAERLRCSDDSVDRAKRELVDLGALLFHHQRGNDGALTVNQYTLIRAAPLRLGGLQFAVGGPRTTAAENENHLEREPSMAPAAPERKVDEVFDVLCALTETDRTQLTSSGRGALNRATKELKAIGAEPDEIRHRYSELERRYPTIRITAPTLVKYWATLGTSQNGHAAPARTLEEDQAELARLMEDL